jgi:hypothetical protein
VYHRGTGQAAGSQLIGQPLARPTVSILQMRRNLPFLLIGVWFLLNGVLALGKSISPGFIGSAWPQRVGVILGGALLSLAVLFSIVAAVRGEHRRRSAAAMALAVALQSGWTGFYVWASGMQEEIAAPFESGFTVEKLAERALNSPASRGRELAASFAFREFGARIQYTDESGNVRTFEPRTVDLEKRERNRQFQVEMANVQAVLRKQAISFRWVALASLLSFGAVFVGAAIVLGGPRRWHGWLTSR